MLVSCRQQFSRWWFELLSSALAYSCVVNSLWMNLKLVSLFLYIVSWIPWMDKEVKSRIYYSPELESSDPSYLHPAETGSFVQRFWRLNLGTAPHPPVLFVTEMQLGISSLCGKIWNNFPQFFLCCLALVLCPVLLLSSAPCGWIWCHWAYMYSYSAWIWNVRPQLHEII